MSGCLWLLHLTALLMGMSTTHRARWELVSVTSLSGEDLDLEDAPLLQTWACLFAELPLCGLCCLILLELLMC